MGVPLAGWAVVLRPPFLHVLLKSDWIDIRPICHIAPASLYQKQAVCGE